MFQSFIKTFYAYYEYCLRGSGQVLFQNHPVTGALFLLSILISSTDVFLGSVSGLIIATILASAFRKKSTPLINGMFGFNGLLIGSMIFNFYALSGIKWILLLAAIPMGFLIQLSSESLFRKLQLPQLTFPFVLTSWILLILFPVDMAGSTGINYSEILLHSFSQVFLVGNNWSGLLILAAVLYSSKESAVWAMGAAIAAVLIVSFTQMPVYGFSAVLTAVGLGSVLRPLHQGSYLTIMAAVVLTILTQIVMNLLMIRWQLPALTAPFLLISWIYLKLYRKN